MIVISATLMNAGKLLKPKAKHQEVGELGEGIACKFLENKGFVVLERNYQKKCGEIDIVAKKGKTLHFIEVKTVSCENVAKNWGFRSSVSRETGEYRPEDNIHAQKIKRLTRVFQVYLLEKCKNREPDWVFDVITVKLDTKNRTAKVKFLGNLML